ncbi:8039_t:CDS:10 [Acaulospora morrowiae]|uniref:8039_t:CDS:1 n=1 Tax=Acaulospora morrowiae TaxID=94023 RepID=A0A9N8WMN6_9GLOM|nr:8039_t:CDS:10 [Acaulospora morrowiae]
MDEHSVQTPPEKASIEAAINKEFEDVQTRVHTFDPNDPPEAKAAQTTQGDGSSVPTKPAAIKEIISDIDDKTEEDKVTSLMPGALAPVSIESASDIPDWARIGWQRVSELATTDPEHDFYESILGELYFGNLWLNAGVVFVAVFATWITTSLGGGLSSAIIICAFVATYFKHSVDRFYRNARSDISRELAKEKLELDTGEESAEWINEFLRRFWLIYEPVLSGSIVQVVDGVLASSTPSFLDSIRLTTFTLGTKPPVVDSIRSYPKTEDDVVVMDWKFSFNPNDLANMTKVQIAKKVNPKIVLTVRVGRGMVGAGIPILLENMSFSGLMRVRLKLINTFPHIKTIDLSFLEEPHIDYALKPIGGETFGFDIANIPGLHPFIKEQINANLRPMMYDPNQFTLDAESLISGYPIDSAIGVLAVTIYGAKGLKNSERFGTSDPYCKLTIRGGQVLAQTKVINDSLVPVWNETFYLIINALSETLNFEIYDSNEVTKDTLMGTATFPLSTLAENPKQEEVTAPVYLNSKAYGEIKFDMNWCPVAEPTETEPAPDSNVGILRFTIHQAKDLDPKRSMIGQYNPYAEIYLNGKKVYTTKVIKRNNSPVWEEPVELFVTDKDGVEISVRVYDARDLAVDPVVASWTGKLSEFLSSKNDWFKVQDAAGKLRMSCIWKPILNDGSLNFNVGAYVNPVGVVRLHIKKAVDVKSSGQLGGKSDPYVSIKLNNVSRGRTEMVPDTLNPEWKDEIFYIPVHAAREIINIEVWDHENTGKDKLLGSTELKVSQLAKQNEDGTYSSTDALDTSAPLYINRETRGNLYFTASFHPIIPPPEVASEDKKGDEVEAPKTGSGDEIPRVVVDNAEYQSGILIITLKEAKMEKRGGFVDVFIDNALFPSYTSNKCKEQNPVWNQVFDVFVKELDWAKVTFNIRQFTDKNPIGTAIANVNSLIEKCKESPEGVALNIDGISDGLLYLNVKYVPVDYVLDPVECVENMGTLNVKVKNAENLPAVDRGGTSDPYIQFLLNDEKIHRTKTVKKDLNPVFDEDFTVIVHSRIGDKFVLEVYDWNQVGSSKKLAHGRLDLSELKSFEAVERKVPLTNNEDGSKAGSVNLRLRFEPQLVNKKRLPTGTFAGATKTITGIGTGVISGGGNVVKGGVGIVGSGVNLVGSGASNVVGAVGSGFGILKKKDKDKEEKKKVEEEKVEPATRSINTKTSETSTQEKPPSVENNGVVKNSTYNVSESSEAESTSESGSLRLTIIEAKDLIAADSGGTSDPYVKVKFNKKDIYKTQTIKKTVNPKWDEVTQIPNLNGSIHLSVKDHNKMGKDVDIGEYDLNIWDHIQPSTSDYTKDIWVDLSKGKNGKLHLKLEYIPKGGNGDLSNSRFSGDSDRDSSEGNRFKLGFRKLRS